MRKECIELLKEISLSSCSKRGMMDISLSEKKRDCVSILLGDDHIQKVDDERNYAVTKRGIEKLEEELDCFVLKGKIVSGLGKGGYYVSREGYKSQFKEKFGIDPYEGTLNVKLASTVLSRWKELQGKEGISIEGFREDEERFGSLKAFRANICGSEGILIIPEKSEYDRTVEVVSRFYLKDKLYLEDGDEVVMLVELDDTIEDLL